MNQEWAKQAPNKRVEQSEHPKVGQASVPAKPAQQASALDPPFPGRYLADAELYRRRLPHLRLDGATYFITGRIFPGNTELTAVEREIVSNALRHFDQKRYSLFAFVVMNDHVHVLFEPVRPWSLSQITHSSKSLTANQIRSGGATRDGRVWQDETFDRIVRNEVEFTEKLCYILNNPSNRWPEMRDYPWLWAAKQLADDVGLQS